MSRARLDSLTVGDATVQDHIVVIGEFIDAISAAAGAKMDNRMFGFISVPLQLARTKKRMT